MKIPKNKLAGKTGGLANETRFGMGYDEREIREHKVMVVPSETAGPPLKIEQAWNRRAAKSKVLRITLGGRQSIIRHDDLEQALAYMMQGDELLKYVQPTIK